MALALCTLSCSLRPTLFSHGGSIANPRCHVFTAACRLRTFVVCSSADEEAVTEQRDMAGNGDDEPMGALDYARFFGTIAGFIAFFYAIAAIFPAAAGAAALPTPLEIAAKVDADWSAAHGTAALSRLYTPGGRVITASADRLEPAADFAAAEASSPTPAAVKLTPLWAEREGEGVIHHLFETCTAGGSCGRGYFRLEQARGSAAWRIATDVWTLTPYKDR